MGPSVSESFPDLGVYNIKCKSGYFWSDGIVIKNITCKNQKWIMDSITCIGKCKAFKLKTE